MSGKFPNPLNQWVNWNGVDSNGDGNPNDGILPNPVNINTVGINGAPATCANGLSNETLNGYDDWKNIVLDFKQFGDDKDAPVNPVNLPEPTLEDNRLLQEELKTSDTLLALLKVGIDFSVPVADLRQWLNNPRFTPYPALAKALLNLLEGKRLQKPVFIDVIRSKYEDELGASSPRDATDVDLSLLKEAILKGYNERYGETITDFQELLL